MEVSSRQTIDCDRIPKGKFMEEADVGRKIESQVEVRYIRIHDARFTDTRHKLDESRPACSGTSL
jgi:hypothetical protein